MRLDLNRELGYRDMVKQLMHMVQKADDQPPRRSSSSSVEPQMRWLRRAFARLRLATFQT